jgi:hypothetical protein
MEDGYIIKRITWDKFEVTMNGESVLIQRGTPVEGCPQCFYKVEEMYAAIKAAHAVAKARSISSIPS